jgi:hypothetical protein
MKLILCCLLFVNFYTGNAKPFTWYSGSIVLADESVLVGEVSVDAFHDVVLYKSSENRVRVFPAFKIKLALYFDPQASINRRFVSWQEDLSVQSTSLYEVVTSGELAILRKPKFNLKDFSDAVAFDYFIKEQNQLFHLKDFARRFYSRLINRPGLLEYVSSEKLNIYQDADAIRIIVFFNKLISTGIVVSSS